MLTLSVEGLERQVLVHLACVDDEAGHVWMGGGAQGYGEVCGDPQDAAAHWVCDQWKAVVGPPAAELVASEAAWSFFSGYP